MRCAIQQLDSGQQESSGRTDSRSAQHNRAQNRPRSRPTALLIKDLRQCHGERTGFPTKPTEQLDTHVQKVNINIDLKPLEINPKWITVLNITLQAIKLPEDNAGENLGDLESLNATSKSGSR